MSCSTSIVYGYGFEVAEVEDKKIIEFIKNHKATFCSGPTEEELYAEMLEYTKEEYDLENFFDGYECDNSGQEGRGAIVSNIISRETGIRLHYQMGQSDCDSWPSVLLPECMPWHLNEKEKN